MTLGTQQPRTHSSNPRGCCPSSCGVYIYSVSGTVIICTRSITHPQSRRCAYRECRSTLNFGCHAHPLTLRERTEVWFKCALCLCHGYGSFYRCPECSTYQIHDSCAEAPDSISFFGHAQHPLALEQATSGGPGRCCDICLYCIHGIHYGCRACGFFLHPVCAKLPPSTISPVHPQHLLTLVPGKGSIYSWKCKDCEEEYDGWHYACGACDVRLHPWCLLGLSDSSMNQKNAPLGIRG